MGKRQDVVVESNEPKGLPELVTEQRRRFARGVAEACAAARLLTGQRVKPAAVAVKEGKLAGTTRDRIAVLLTVGLRTMEAEWDEFGAEAEQEISGPGLLKQKIA
ncbi:MAG: hypothetical protein FD152_686 [Xanthobacteraceae bacterium]|nr:MAG: hypothetical protein FD152_686 [Xanthobacteraceae bacterium]